MTTPTDLPYQAGKYPSAKLKWHNKCSADSRSPAHVSLRRGPSHLSLSNSDCGYKLGDTPRTEKIFHASLEDLRGEAVSENRTFVNNASIGDTGDTGGNQSTFLLFTAHKPCRFPPPRIPL
jgi:hypothetical protein